MKIKLVTESTQEYPDGTQSKAHVIFFEEGDRVVHKVIKVSDCVRAVAKPDDDFVYEYVYLIRKAIREAELDFVFMEYGDKWKEHKPTKGFFTKATTDEEKELIALALSEIYGKDSRELISD